MPRTYTRSCECRRCPKCRDRERKRLAYRLKKEGRWPGWIDAAPVGKHVKTLIAAGVGIDSIARAAGVSHSTVFRLSKSQCQRVTAEVAESVMAVTTRDALHVNPTGTRRRIQALCALGWSMKQQADVLGVRQSDIAHWCAPQRSWVMRETADRVRVLYDKLSMTPGPSELSRKLAESKGWPPPLSWDDDRIDDPRARPIIAGTTDHYARLLPSDKAQLAAEVNRSGVAVVAERYRSTPGAVNKALARGGYRAVTPNNQSNGEHPIYRKDAA